MFQAEHLVAKQRVFYRHKPQSVESRQVLLELGDIVRAGHPGLTLRGPGRASLGALRGSEGSRWLQRRPAERRPGEGRVPRSRLSEGTEESAVRPLRRELRSPRAARVVMIGAGGSPQCCRGSAASGETKNQVRNGRDETTEVETGTRVSEESSQRSEGKEINRICGG